MYLPPSGDDRSSATPTVDSNIPVACDKYVSEARSTSTIG